MDSKRSSKSRSIGTDSKSSRSSISQSRHESHYSKGSRSSARSSGVDSRSKRAISDESVSTWRGPEGRSVPEGSQVRASKDSPTAEPAGGAGKQINLAVVGAMQINTSTFTKRALDLQKPPKGPYPNGKVSLEGKLYRVQMLELVVDDIEFSGGHQISWPENVNDSPTPAIDGVLCLYDVTDQNSIADIPEFLAALCTSRIPCVLVPCKSDANPEQRQVDSRFNSQVNSTFPAVEICETSSKTPDSPKRCLLGVLKLILRTSQSSARLPSPQLRRPRHTIQTYTTSTESENISVHARSKSELTPSNPRGFLSSNPPKSRQELDSSLDVDEEVSRADNRTPPAIHSTAWGNKASQISAPQTPLSASGIFVNGLVSPSDDGGSETPETPDSLYMSMMRPGTATTVGSQSHRTFLDMGEDSQDDSSECDPEVQQISMKSLHVSKDSKDEPGLTFDELVDQLLMLPKSKRQVKFEPIFLCLYRAFATPLQLLKAFVARFEAVENSKDIKLTKAGEQLRYLQVLGLWTANYPGDFSSSSVRVAALSFIAQIAQSKIFKGAAKEISNNLDVSVKDDDLDWAFSDEPVTQNSLATTKAIPEKNKKPVGQPQESDEDSDDDSDDADLESSPRHSNPPSMTSSLVRTANTSSQSLANLLLLESARQKAQKLKPIPRIPLSKLQWHQFMDAPSEDFAREITRMDWTMYTAIRPREFVRHVCVSNSSRRRSHNADNIGMMVKHFNHLALFVSGMILLRDKPKHRAKALEKFMTIAWKVRQLNNYNSLGAIVAGLNGPEIQRLGMTRDLVPPQAQKDFLRLTILMGHSRSHAAYRMAWENSSAERIPFIPLLRQDLTRAEMGNRTFLDQERTKIHWKKFEIMGEVILGIQKSQQQPYTFSQLDDDITKMILETRVLDVSEDSADPRDELQRRSELVEPAGIMADPSRKKFDWFRR